jgi:hypothetical protein
MPEIIFEKSDDDVDDSAAVSEEIEQLEHEEHRQAEDAAFLQDINRDGGASE